MAEKIQITLLGKDNVLAAILAEQATGNGRGRHEYDFAQTQDASTAQNADVWIIPATLNVPQSDASPLCIRIAEAGEMEGSSDDIVFTKPIHLPALLDAAIGGAKLRRRKQPRALATTHMFKPFARLVEETATGRSVTLTEKEASFLCAVLDAGQKGLSRKDAMTELWGYHPDAESHAVDTTLYRLRQKLQELGNIDTNLVNEGGIYKWRNL